MIVLLITVHHAYTQDPIKIDSLKICLESSKEDTSKYKICRELSEIYTKTDLMKSLQYARQALEHAKKSQQKVLETRAQILVGNSFLFLGIWDNAMGNYLSALKLAQDNDFVGEELVSLTSLGIIQDRLDNFDQSLEYYFKALDIYNRSIADKKSLNGVKKIQALYNNIGNIYSSKKEYETAIEYYLKGLDLSEKALDNQNIGNICNNLGKLEIERKNFEKAFQYLNKALEARQKENNKSGIAKSYLFIGNYYQAINQLDSSQIYAERALQTGLEMQEQLTIENANNMLFEIFMQKGDYKKALEYHIQFKNASDSLINKGKIEEMTRLQMQFEYAKSEQEREESREKMRYAYIIILSGLILLIIIFGLLFFLGRSRNKRIKLQKEKLEEDMMIKNKELTTNVIYLMQKNELIDNITSRLLNLKEKLKPENKEPVQKIIYDLQALTNNDAWNEFEIRFQNVHEQFYKNLQQKFPDLSPSEIKLAAFLRLNMSSKEIASITGQSINSLETARYRLRKKLGITNQEVNLVNFLLNI